MNKLQELGINLLGRNSGSIKTFCPKCSESRKNKRDKCLSVEINEGVYNCHNCGWAGTVNESKKIEKKEYKVPVFNNTQLSDKTLNWFVETRGISKSTVMRFQISESVEWMPQVEKEMTSINFNYFRNGQLINIKFRDAKKNFKLSKDAELIFYNLDSVLEADTVIICEGEIDCLSFYESGLYEAVSVPNGASKGSMKLEYLDNCWQYFENKTKIIIATDNDEPGLMLREELARRLGKDRCWIFKYPDGCKDANDVLLKFGSDGLRQCYDQIIEYPIEGIKTVLDLEERIDDLYINGFPKGSRIGFDYLDDLISWRPGEFTTFTGIPGSGKSEFVDQIMVKLANHHDWRWAIFSAENQPEELHFTKLSEKFFGKSFYSTNQDYRMTPEELYQCKVFVNDHFFFINIEDANISLDGLLQKGKELVRRKGINGFMIDPWNYIEHKIPSGYTETQYISEALTKIARFTKMHNIHIIIVAHPTKIQKEPTGKYRVATLYDIAGSAHWFNKTDNGVSVYRDFETNIVDVYVQKIRFKFIGKIGRASFEWDKHTGRYKELNDNIF